MTEPSSVALVRLVAGREISARIRDKNFIVSSLVIIVLILGITIFQVVLDSGASQTRIGVVGVTSSLETALERQGQALGQPVVVTGLADESAARTAIEDGEIDAALLDGAGRNPVLLVQSSPDALVLGIVQGAVGQRAISRRLAEVAADLGDVPQVGVTSLDPQADADGQRTAVALIGVVVLYSLLVLSGQFVAQGVVEEKASRVVELLLAAMKPWQLLAGKIIGLGLLGLGQLLVIAAIGVGGALAFDLVDVPAELLGTVVSVIAWFVLGYAFYASVFAVAASLVSRQEDLASVLTPTTLLLVVAFVIAFPAAGDPDGTLARVTSLIPGLSPMVMPVRQAAGEVPAWEVGLAVVLMLAAVALIVALGGRVYAGALLRTGGKLKLTEALRG